MRTKKSHSASHWAALLVPSAIDPWLLRRFPLEVEQCFGGKWGEPSTGKPLAVGPDQLLSVSVKTWIDFCIGRSVLWPAKMLRQAHSRLVVREQDGGGGDCRLVMEEKFDTVVRHRYKKTWVIFLIITLHENFAIFRFGWKKIHVAFALDHVRLLFFSVLKMKALCEVLKGTLRCSYVLVFLGESLFTYHVPVSLF